MAQDSVKSQPEALSLFYDELANIVFREKLEPKLLVSFFTIFSFLTMLTFLFQKESISCTDDCKKMSYTVLYLQLFK